MSRARGTLVLALAVARGWRNQARQRIGGPVRLRFAVGAAVAASVATDVAVLHGHAPSSGPALPDAALGPALSALFVVVGLVASAALVLATPDAAELDAFVATTGLPPGLRRLGCELPVLGVLVVLFVGLALPLAAAVSPRDLTPADLAMRLLGTWCASSVGLLAGRVATTWVSWLLRRVGVASTLARALSALVTLGTALLVLGRGQVSPDRLADPPWWSRVVGALMIASRWTPLALVCVLVLLAACLTALVVSPHSPSQDGTDRPLPLLLSTTARPLSRWRAALLTCWREPTVALWVLLSVASPLAIVVLDRTSTFPAREVAPLLVVVPALLAGYPYGVAREVRAWCRAADPDAGIDARPDLVAAAVLVGCALVGEIVVAQAVLRTGPAWPLALLVAAVSLGWGRLVPVRTTDPVSWFVLDLLTLVTGVVVCVLTVRLAVSTDSPLLLQVVSMLALATVVTLVAAPAYRRGRRSHP